MNVTKTAAGPQLDLGGPLSKIIWGQVTSTLKVTSSLNFLNDFPLGEMIPRGPLCFWRRN